MSARDLATLARPMSQLSDNEYLFTSESVTEGHPDKIADQISDGVLDAVLRDDPYGRVACETLVNTGLVVVSGEITQERQPPAKQGHRLKLLYMTQFQTSPPRFSVQVNSRNRVTRDYAYFIENRLRARYGMDGVPLIIDFHERKQRRNERS